MTHALVTTSQANNQVGTTITHNHTPANNATLIVVGLVIAGATQRSGGNLTIGGVAASQANANQGATAGFEAGIEVWYRCAAFGANNEVSISIPNSGNQTIHVEALSAYAGSGNESAFHSGNGTANNSCNGFGPLVFSQNAEGDFKYCALSCGEAALGSITFTWTGANNAYAIDQGAYTQWSKYLIAGATNADPTWVWSGDDGAAVGVCFKTTVSTVTKKIIDETMNLVDGMVRKASSLRISNESLNLMDGLVRKLSSVKVVNEILQWVVISTAILTKYVWIIPNTINIVEGFVKKTSAGLVQIANDTLAIVEVAIRNLRSVRLISESLLVIEGFVRALRSVRIKNEVEEISDSLVKVLRAVRIAADTIELLEGTVRKSFTALVKISSDVIEIVEGTAKRLIAIKIVSDILALVEGFVRWEWSVRIKSETLALVEGFVRKSKTVMIAGDLFHIVEGFVRRSRAVRLIAETIEIPESTVRKTFTALVKIVSETLNIVEGTVRKLTTQVSKVINETLNIVEEKVRRYYSVRIVNEVERWTESSVRRLRAIPIINESVNLVENVVRRMWTIKIVNETVRLVDLSIKWISGLIETWWKVFRASRVYASFDAIYQSMIFRAVKKPTRFDAE